jgi:hypothetical protein
MTARNGSPVVTNWTSARRASGFMYGATMVRQDVAADSEQAISGIMGRYTGSGLK